MTAPQTLKNTSNGSLLSLPSVTRKAALSPPTVEPDL